MSTGNVNRQAQQASSTCEDMQGKHANIALKTFDFIQAEQFEQCSTVIVIVAQQRREMKNT
jgi:hypothetical protein